MTKASRALSPVLMVPLSYVVSCSAMYTLPILVISHEPVQLRTQGLKLARLLCVNRGHGQVKILQEGGRVTKIHFAALLLNCRLVHC